MANAENRNYVQEMIDGRGRSKTVVVAELVERFGKNIRGADFSDPESVLNEGFVVTPDSCANSFEMLTDGTILGYVNTENIVKRLYVDPSRIVVSEHFSSDPEYVEAVRIAQNAIEVANYLNKNCQYDISACRRISSAFEVAATSVWILSKWHSTNDLLAHEIEDFRAIARKFYK